MSRLLVTLSWGLAGVAIAGALTVPDWMAGFVVDVPASVGNRSVGPTSKPSPALSVSAPDPAIAELLARSPFDQQRRFFTRDLPVDPPPPPPPPKLLGVSMQKGKRIAVVEWPATGQTQRLSVGDTTGLGKVVAMDGASLTLKGATSQIVISLFQ